MLAITLPKIDLEQKYHIPPKRFDVKTKFCPGSKNALSTSTTSTSTGGAAVAQR
jgi:hypothetical protein